MLKTEIARDFVERLSAHLDYNINIMDDRGYIIASRDRSRIGDFHEAAHRIVNDNESIEIIYPDERLSPGVKPGVNLPIVHRGKAIGVVGVTGNPSEIMSLAYAVKTSVEATVEYEMYKERMERRQSTKNLFQSLLLYDEAATAEELRTVGEKLGYTERCVRVAVVFRFDAQVDCREILDAMKRLPSHSRQDISFITAGHDILVFKVVEPHSGSITGTVKEAVGESVRQIDSALLARDLRVRFRVYVGSLQSRFPMYRTSYEHVQWLMNASDHAPPRIHYFSDCIDSYVRSSLPDALFENLFSTFGELIPPSMLPTLRETAGALLRNNMNMSNAAAELAVHRNTLRSRIEQIRDHLGIDPFQVTSDRDFLRYLYEYLKLHA